MFASAEDTKKSKIKQTIHKNPPPSFKIIFKTTEGTESTEWKKTQKEQADRGAALHNCPTKARSAAGGRGLPRRNSAQKGL